MVQAGSSRRLISPRASLPPALTTRQVASGGEFFSWLTTSSVILPSWASKVASQPPGSVRPAIDQSWPVRNVASVVEDRVAQQNDVPHNTPHGLGIKVTTWAGRGNSFAKPGIVAGPRTSLSKIAVARVWRSVMAL